MDKRTKKIERRNKIRTRIRSAVSGTAERPRLSVFKSNKHVTIQLIDDIQGMTLVGLSTVSGALADQVKGKPAMESARIVGEAVAKAATERGITKAVFDRGGYRYHGVVKSAAEGARAGGLDF
jgi:large subunit ribosomal protein L18